jgi:hypothetical protein
MNIIIVDKASIASTINNVLELKEKVINILSHDDWYISSRVENDGKAGNVFEDLLGIVENNRRGADIVFNDGTMCELKTSKTKGTAITMAGLVPEYLIPQRESIERYGTTKPSQPDVRRFYTTYKVGAVNPRGLKTEIKDDCVVISDVKTGEGIMKWPVNDIIDKLASKCGTVVHTDADRSIIGGREAYKYKKSKYYEDFNREKARKLLAEGKIVTETRSKIQSNGSIRDRGTVFRIPRKHLPELYDNVYAWDPYDYLDNERETRDEI